jgi:hypothetical protein
VTVAVVFAIAGTVALLIGIFGGGIKAKEIEIPQLSANARLVATIVGIILIALAYLQSPISIIAPDTQTTNDQDTGDIDLQEFCQSLGYSGVNQETYDVNGWRCQASDGTLSEIDLVEACKWQYGNQRPVPRFRDAEDALSWKCYPE